jgi:ABC-type polysaccharide/polyol phosphate transport system ATPase subunit
MSDAAWAVRLAGVTKEFLGGRQKRTLFRVVKTLVKPSNGTRPRSLDAIDLEIPSGEILGVIGENGAGKTTLLKTIAGLYLPTAGAVHVNGEVALLAGLGAGMIDELTVSDNVWLYGAVCRVRRAKIRARFDDVLRWAELESFANAELRTLSMGMRTRLAFAIAMQIDSETVLMDEAFSAGDKRFQDKCNRFFEDSRSAGRTFVIATHNLDFVRTFCTRTLWLHKGRRMEFGPTAAVLERYIGFEKRS